MILKLVCQGEKQWQTVKIFYEVLQNIIPDIKINLLFTTDKQENLLGPPPSITLWKSEESFENIE